MNVIRNYSDINTIHSSDITCPIKIQYCESDHGLYIEYDTNSELFDKFYKLCQNTNSIQRNFFLDPVVPKNDDEGKRFVFCPGYDLTTFFFPKEKTHEGLRKTQESLRKAQESLYQTLSNTEKMYIMKWVFSIACAIKILLKNNFEVINVFDRSFFIDSNMDARFSYASWETEYDLYSTYQISQYFQAPEKIKSKNPKFKDISKKPTNIEKQCSYSLGVLMFSLLNKRLPNVYFPRLSIDEINEYLVKGDIYRSNIPSCKWNKIIRDCINVENPLDRPDIDAIIRFIINKENCFDGVDYDEFRKFVAEKFGCDEKTDISQFYKEIIEPNLSKISENANNSIPTDLLRISDLPKFIKLAKNTSFEQSVKDNCTRLLIYLQNYYKNRLDNRFNINETTKNPFQLMDDLLRTTRSDDSEEESINDNLDICAEDHIKDYLDLLYSNNMDVNSSFYIRIYKNNGKIFLVPNELNLPDDYYNNFSKNKLFAHVDNTFRNEITFYPFLNIYSILYGNSSKRDFKIQDKLKWLLQTAEALSILHEQKYSVKYFNSTDIFIDINSDAHFLPFQIVENQSLVDQDTDFFEQPDFVVSCIAPEMISNTSIISVTEKQAVYSFGVFMNELIYGNRPGQFLNNLSIEEKKDLLLNKRKFSLDQDDSLFQLVQSCLDLNPEERKTFKEIISYLTNILKEKNENSQNDGNSQNNQTFSFNNLEEASNKGARTPDMIIDFIYSTFDIDELLELDNCKKKFKDNISKFKLIWAVYFKGEIYSKSTDSQFNGAKKVKKRIFTTKNQNYTNPTKNQFNSFSNFAGDYLNNFHVTMKKVHNKPVPLALNLAGLSMQSARQTIMRINYNFDPNYRKQVEYSVRNHFDYPYGSILKMKNVEDIVNDMIREGAFQKNTAISKTAKGNLKTDSQVL